MMSLGQFDVVNYGFAVQEVNAFLVKENGIAIVPIAT